MKVSHTATWPPERSRAMETGFFAVSRNARLNFRMGMNSGSRLGLFLTSNWIPY